MDIMEILLKPASLENVYGSHAVNMHLGELNVAQCAKHHTGRFGNSDSRNLACLTLLRMVNTVTLI